MTMSRFYEIAPKKAILLNGLLPKLMRGDIRVKEVEAML
jgi:hypothetical protein